MEENNSIVIHDDVIIEKIYIIRGEKVMLDVDLAKLYGVETKQLKRAVRRNINRFPSDFMFELTKVENEILKSQIAINKRGQHSKYLPFAFTEDGISMLSSVLNSEVAIMVNVQIMRILRKARRIIMEKLNMKLEIEKIKKKLTSQDKNIELVFSYLDELMEKQENPQPKKRIGFKTKDKE